MSLTKKIATNTIIHTLGKFIGSAIGLFVIGLVTRYLGTENYGYYTTIMAYLFFFATIGDLGLYLITINELGREGIDKKKFFSNIFTMRLVSGIILMALANGLIWFFPYPRLIKVGTLIFSLAILLMMVDQITTALFQQKMQTKFVALSEIAGKILILLATIIVIKMDLGFLFILWTVFVGFSLHFLINIFYSRKLLQFTLAFNKEIWQNIFKKSWPVATYMLFSVIYFKADTIVLSLYHSQTAVGLYGAPYKILEVLISFTAIFMGLVSPHLSRSFSQTKSSNLVDYSEFKKYFQKSFDFLSAITWPLIFGTIVLSRPIINIIAGKDFLASAPILQILIIATGIIFIAHLPNFAVVALEKQRKMIKFYILSACLALVLYFALIPKYSYFAAAWITVGVEFLILIFNWNIVIKTTKIKISFKNNLKSFFAAATMGVIMFFLNWPFVLSVLSGFIVYVLLIWKLRVLKNILYFMER